MRTRAKTREGQNSSGTFCVSMPPETERGRLSLHSPFRAQIGCSQLSPLIPLPTRSSTLDIKPPLSCFQFDWDAQALAHPHPVHDTFHIHWQEGTFYWSEFWNSLSFKKKVSNLKVAFTHLAHCLHGCFVRTEWYTEKSLNCYKDKVMIWDLSAGCP